MYIVVKTDKLTDNQEIIAEFEEESKAIEYVNSCNKLNNGYIYHQEFAGIID